MRGGRNSGVGLYIFFGGVIGLALLSYVAVGVLNLVFFGGGLDLRTVFHGLLQIIDPKAGLHSKGVGFVAAAIVMTLVLLGLVVWGLVAWRRWYQAWKLSDRQVIKELKSRKGLATRQDIRKYFSAQARLAQAGTVRPGTLVKQACEAGVKVGSMHFEDVYLSLEDSVVLEGAPRSGKGFRLLIPAIIDFPGPVITTSTRPDNLAATMMIRKKYGTVTVFDPQGLAGIKDSMRISPVTGCSDPLVATQRAAAIMGGTALGASNSNAEWAAEAENILAQLLLAASVSGKDAVALRDWGASPALARPAVEILRGSGAPGWADSLEATLDSDPKLLQSKWMGVSAALKPLQLPSVLESMTPTVEHPLFDVDEFLAGRNTLYLIGTRSGAGASGGFLGAVLDDIVEQARKKAARSEGARLNPPLGLILDELANLFAWKQLPIVLSDGGGIGIWTLVVLQALSQAETSWSQAEAQTIWSSSIAKILLGGASDASHLRDVELMLGERKRRSSNRTYLPGQLMAESMQEQTERVPVISAAELRQLPEGLGLLAYKNKRGVLLDMPGWVSRKDADEIGRGKKLVEAMQRDVFDGGVV